MGMFDTVKCMYDLPYSTEQKAELSLINESSTTRGEFQTKCLECWMQDYMINSDGLLLIHIKENKKKPYKKYKYTGAIEMYNYLTSDREAHDLDYRWKIKFKNGVVSKCKLMYMKRQSNHMRRTSETRCRQHRQMMNERIKTIRWKIYQACWRGPVAVLFNSYRFLTSKLPNSIRLENQLKFWD